MTALLVVGALVAVAGTALILSTLLWLDEAAPAVSAAAQRVETAGRTPHRRAA